MSDAVDKAAALLGAIMKLEADLDYERRLARRWQELAGRYDEIRYALRNCEDNRVGHAEFYSECIKLIFGDDE